MTGVRPPTGDAWVDAATARLAIVAPTWVGDAVMSTPLLRAARRRCPRARIALACAPGLAPLFDGCPWIDERLAVPGKGALGPWRVGTALRRFDPEAVVLLPNSFRSALAARLSGAPRRIGTARDGRSLLLTHRFPHPRPALPVPTIDDYAALATRAFGPDPDLERPELATTGDERERAEALLRDVPRPFVVLVPGASKPAKRWPAERFAAAADALARDPGVACVVVGAPNEAPIQDAVCAAARTPVTGLAGRAGFDLGALKAVIAEAAAVLTNDTGPRHLALALGTPVACLYGPTDHRWTTVRGAREHALRAQPFLPETSVADRFAAACAIDRISVGDAAFAVRRLLRG